MNKRQRWEYIGLAAILLALFWLRMTLSFAEDSLSYDSYLTVRHVENILSEGVPITEDPLSITGRMRVQSPTFEYLLAAFVWLSPIAYKVLPNLFMTLLILPVFMLAMRLTKSYAASLISVVLAGSGPYVFSSYLITPSSASLAVALFLTVLMLIEDMDSRLFWIILFTVLLVFIHPVVFILVFTLLILLLILKMEGFGIDRRVTELFFFTLLLSLWFYVIVYKRAFFAEGMVVLWQNLPADMAAATFGNLTFLGLLYGMGVITFLFGVIGTYNALFETRTRTAFAVIAAIIAVSIAGVLRVLEIQLALLLLTVLLSIMASHGLMVSFEYMRMTRVPWITYPIAVLILILFIFSAVLPALGNARLALEDSPSQEQIAAYIQIKAEVPSSAVLLTTIKEGWAVQYFSGHTTLTDADFLMVDKSDELVSDIDSVYTARFITPLVGRSEKLGFTHILFSEHAAVRYARDEIKTGETACLQKSYLTPNTLLYRVLCGGRR